MRHWWMGLAVLIGLGGPAMGQSAETLAAQREAYDAVRAKSVIELQPFRDRVEGVEPETGRRIALTSLNPAVGGWFLLELQEGEAEAQVFHIENPAPQDQSLSLQAAALKITTSAGDTLCQPWQGDALAEAAATGLAYAPICDGTLLLRNPVKGARTNLEAAAEFLRDNVWGGESIVRFVRERFFKDAELETAEAQATAAGAVMRDGPPPMLTRGTDDQRRVINTLLDIGIEEAPGNALMAIGAWYKVADTPGVYASAFQPRAISDTVLNGPGTTHRIDAIEGKATGYMVAFDLAQFDMGFAMGTDHPALGWSPRPAASARVKGLPGPDGIKSAKPLVLLGMVNPVVANDTVATFSAGFKRQHGAFKFGDMATFNLGHHYGFIEQGVILSKLQPNLSTLYGLTDGSIHMKTWTEADNALLPQIRFARQNGVPLLETDPETGLGVPGDRVTRWGPGNWSGSAKAELRTLRAGGCMVEDDGTQYLLYGYFSTATPSAMARTFQAYGCRYAMLLDMNALEHTYLALYVPRAGKVHVQHMVPGMGLIDKKIPGGEVLPRFIGYPDNRDLFYLTRKEGRP
ncbi:MAG: hypothetical protein QNJ09_10300 [Paracoccaceae bacterium]|nr:hypothetical protein [Paracoccaceae bacterium]